MKSKIMRRWCSVIVGGGLLLVAVVGSVYGLFSNNAMAATSKYETAWRNVAVRALAKNLSECYTNEQDKVSLAIIQGVYNYGSSVYWKDPDMTVELPVSMAGKKDEKTSVTCAEMITGWTTGFWNNLFRNTTFVGVKQNVVVPQAGNVSFDTLRQYFVGSDGKSGIGYEEVAAESQALNGFKCLYFHMTGANGALSHSSLGLPSNGSRDLYSDAICVKVDNNDKIDFGYGEGAISARDESDQGGNKLALDTSGRSKLYIFTANKPALKGGSTVVFNITISAVTAKEATYPSNSSIRKHEMTPDECAASAPSADWCTDDYRKITSWSVTINNNNTSSSTCSKWENKMCYVGGIAARGSTPDVSYNDFVSELAQYMRGLTIKGEDTRDAFRLFDNVEPLTLTKGAETTEFQKTRNSTLEKFVGYFLDNASSIISSGYAMDYAEQYMFYYKTLKNYFADGQSNYLHDAEAVVDGEDGKDYYTVYWLNESTGNFEQKKLALPSAVTKTACALDGSVWPGKNCTNSSRQRDWKYFASMLKSNFSDPDKLAEEFDAVVALDKDYNDAADGKTPGGTNTNGSNGDDDVKKACNDVASVGMKWLLCPTLNSASYTASAFDNMVEDWLSYDTDMYNTESGTYIAWEIMRNIANVLIVLVLLVIIFSQLTGYGIDNYGVKKMLPRLIVMAIIINLSFYICEIAVDLSNIFGVGLRDMFGGIGQTVMDMKTGTTGQAPYTFGSMVLGLLGAAITAGGGAASVALEAAPLVAAGGMGIGIAILIILLLVVVAVVIALLIFFVMLGARAIIMIMCIVLSPVAFALFILPNTQKITKRWWDLFKAVLIIFPICGAMGGISYLVKCIVYTNGEYQIGTVLIAMVSPYIVFFLLPTLLKQAIAAAGKIGGALSALGSSVRGGVNRGANAAVGAIRQSDQYKDLQRRGKANMADAANKKIQNAKTLAGQLNDKIARGEALTARERMSLSRANRMAKRANTGAGIYQYAARDQRVQQQHDSEVAAMQLAMREDTNNYNMDTMSTQLSNIMDKMDNDPGSVTDVDRLRAEALAAQMSQMEGGAGKLANAIAKMKDNGEIISERTGASATFLGKAMAQNAKVRQAMEGKFRTGAMRVSDISSGTIDSRMGQDMYDKLDAGYVAHARRTGQGIKLNAAGDAVEGQDEWLEAEYNRTGGASGNNGMTLQQWKDSRLNVAQDTMRNVLDKDRELVSQKGAVVARYANPETIGQERINKMANRQGLFDYGEVARGTEDLIKNMAIRSEGTFYAPAPGGMGPGQKVEVVSQGGRYYVNDGSGGLGTEISQAQFENYQTEAQYNQAAERALAEGQQEMRVREEAVQQQAQARAQIEADTNRRNAESLMYARNQQAQQNELAWQQTHNDNMAQELQRLYLIPDDTQRRRIEGEIRQRYQQQLNQHNAETNNFINQWLNSAQRQQGQDGLWTVPAGYQKVDGYNIWYDPSNPSRPYYDARSGGFTDRIS